MERIKTMTKFSRSKSISTIELFFYFIVIDLFSASFNYKGKLLSFIVKKIFLKIGFKEV